MIRFICESCAHHNRRSSGTAGFEFKGYEFTSFSDAVIHVINNPSHFVSLEIEDNSEDE